MPAPGAPPVFGRNSTSAWAWFPLIARLRTSMTMALIFKVPMAFRCCKMPERMAALSLACFRHALGPRSPAASTSAKTKRFMLLSFSARERLRPLGRPPLVTRTLPWSFLESIAHVEGQGDVDNGQNGESITERPMDHVPKLEDALRAAEERDAFGQLGLGFGDAQGTLEPRVTSGQEAKQREQPCSKPRLAQADPRGPERDRKSTRLNSSHMS